MRVIVLYKNTNFVIVGGFTRRIWPNKTLQSYNATAVTGFVRRAKKRQRRKTVVKKREMCYNTENKFMLANRPKKKVNIK